MAYIKKLHSHQMTCAKIPWVLSWNSLEGLCRSKMLLLVDDLVPRVLCIRWQKVCIVLDVHGGLLSLGLGLVCSFLGLFDFRHKVHLQCWVSWTGLSSSHTELLVGLLGNSNLSIGGVMKLSYLSYCLLDPTALFCVHLVRFHLGLELSPSLHCFKGRSHMDEECLAHTRLPDSNS